MYEERKNSFTFRDIILQLILVVLFIFVLIWLFPTKGYIDQNYASSEEVSQISQQLQALYGRVFADNIESMRDAAEGYFTSPRLPKNVGDSVTLTLKEMQDKKMVLDFKDGNNQSCDTSKSYVQLTKMDDEYQLKVQLTCSDYSDYIIVYMGCYSYCENAICEPQQQVEQKPTTPTKPTTNPTPSTPKPTPVVTKKYQYEYRLTTQNTYSDWSNWSKWSTKKVTPDNLTQVEIDTDKILKGYEQDYEIIGYNKETYIDYVSTGDKVVDTKKAISGIKYEYADAIKKTTSATTSNWKYAGYVTKFYALSTAVAEDSTVKYVFDSYGYEAECTGCNYKVTYNYKKYTRTYTAGTTTYSCPTGYTKSQWFDSNHKCYKEVSDGTYSCDQYGSDYKLSGTNCVKTTAGTKAVTKTRWVPVYGYVDGDPIYATKTYYRYRTRKQLTVAGTTTKWSNSNNDTTLLNQGYVLTGNKKEV